MNTTIREVVSSGDEAVQARALSDRKEFKQRPKKFGRTYGKSPRQHNGLHRRRKKKLRW